MFFSFALEIVESIFTTEHSQFPHINYIITVCKGKKLFRRKVWQIAAKAKHAIMFCDRFSFYQCKKQIILGSPSNVRRRRRHMHIAHIPFTCYTSTISRSPPPQRGRQPRQTSKKKCVETFRRREVKFMAKVNEIKSSAAQEKR